MAINNPIKLKDLMEDGVVFTVNSERTEDIENETDEDLECRQNMLNFLNLQVVGEDIQDEDTYIEGQPFEKIASKMTNLLENGKIKKRIIRTGYGEKSPDKAIVRVHYNGYIEYTAEPFDSTYARKRVHQFTINNGDVLLGLDLAVQSMLLNEKSQFLISPEYAYGPLGCLSRVPANAEVLFEIELLEIVNVGAAMTFQCLPDEDKKKFEYIYKYCLALCAKGKDLFAKAPKAAVKEYNTAVYQLELAQLDNYDDQVKQQELLMRLYTNLLVCYTREGESKKGCHNFNKIREMVKGTDLKIPAKCYFNNAKCLKMLGDFDLAKKRLNDAYRMEPKNPDILNELVKLDEEIKIYHRKEKELAKALMNSAK